MRVLLIMASLLLSSGIVAQERVVNYDGGADLIKMIEKIQSGAKIKDDVKRDLEIIRPPERTREETLFFILWGEESPSYLRRLVLSEYWKEKTKIAKQTEVLSKLNESTEEAGKIKKENDSYKQARYRDSLFHVNNRQYE